MQPIRPLFALLLSCAMVGAADPPVLLKEIVAGTGASNPKLFTPVGGTVFFVAGSAGQAGELWKTDGTSAGTVMVKRPRSGMDAQTTFLTAVGGTLYFVTTTDANGAELWKSDGTEAGTVLVKDIRSGALGSAPALLTNHNGTLYFTATNGSGAGEHGRELWKSDGTAVGTVMVKDIFASAGDSIPSYLTSVGPALFFSATSSTNGNELWKSDGTDAGTVMVKDIQAGTFQGVPQALFNAGGTLYFNANDGVNGTELWKSDGTDAGTVMVKDINSGIGNSLPDGFVTLGGYVYFRAWLSGTYRLWRTDGTGAGTTEVAALAPARLSLSDLAWPSTVLPRRLQVFDGALYFVTASDNQLYRSDGTPAGTTAVMTLGTAFGTDYVLEMVATASSLFVISDSTNLGRELWISDGTTGGTAVAEIRAGAGSASAMWLAAVGNTVYLSASDGATGAEPFISAPDLPPVLATPVSGVAAVTMSEDGAPTAFAAPTISASDPEAGTLTWSLASAAGHGTATCSGTGAAPGVLAYAPAADWNGTDSFTIRATDPAGKTVSVQIDVTVQAVNDPPVATADPQFSGSPFYRSVLSLTAGTWNDDKDGGGAVTVAYAWLRDGTPIVGQTSDTYVCVASDVGAGIRGRVTATDAGGASTVVLLDPQTIGPYPLWYDGVAVASKVYDGTMAATLSGTPTLHGSALGDDVSLDLSGVSATFASADVGIGKTVTITGLGLTGAQATLYVITTSTTATATITSAAAVVTLADHAVTFDGNPHALVPTTTPPGLGTTVLYDGSSTAPSAVGVYTVVATISDPNYTGTDSATLTITAAGGGAAPPPASGGGGGACGVGNAIALLGCGLLVSITGLRRRQRREV